MWGVKFYFLTLPGGANTAGPARGPGPVCEARAVGWDVGAARCPLPEAARCGGARAPSHSRPFSPPPAPPPSPTATGTAAPRAARTRRTAPPPTWASAAPPTACPPRPDRAEPGPAGASHRPEEPHRVAHPRRPRATPCRAHLKRIATRFWASFTGEGGGVGRRGPWARLWGARVPPALCVGSGPASQRDLARPVGGPPAGP